MTNPNISPQHVHYRSKACCMREWKNKCLWVHHLNTGLYYITNSSMNVIMNPFREWKALAFHSWFPHSFPVHWTYLYLLSFYLVGVYLVCVCLILSLSLYTHCTAQYQISIKELCKSSGVDDCAWWTQRIWTWRMWVVWILAITANC